VRCIVSVFVVVGNVITDRAKRHRIGRFGGLSGEEGELSPTRTFVIIVIFAVIRNVITDRAKRLTIDRVGRRCY
jgi:hypothetical protein